MLIIGKLKTNDNLCTRVILIFLSYILSRFRSLSQLTTLVSVLSLPSPLKSRVPGMFAWIPHPPDGPGYSLYSSGSQPFFTTGAINSFIIFSWRPYSNVSDFYLLQEGVREPSVIWCRISGGMKKGIIKVMIAKIVEVCVIFPLPDCSVSRADVGVFASQNSVTLYRSRMINVCVFRLDI